jgi:hypothetical protein
MTVWKPDKNSRGLLQDFSRALKRQKLTRQSKSLILKMYSISHYLMKFALHISPFIRLENLKLVHANLQGQLHEQSVKSEATIGQLNKLINHLHRRIYVLTHKKRWLPFGSEKVAPMSPSMARMTETERTSEYIVCDIFTAVE